jgi:hypothetical protein
MATLAPAPRPATRRRRRRARITWVVVLGVLATAAVWWSQPRAFDAYGDLVEAPVEVGSTANVNLLLPSKDVAATIRSIRADVVENTSGATIELVLCSTPDSGAGIGAGFGELGPSDCDRVRPVRSAGEVDWREESLVVRVTPSHAGTVRIAGARVTYTRDWRHLWQSGTERTGTEVVVTTP